MSKGIAWAIAFGMSVAGYSLLWQLGWRVTAGVGLVAIANVIFNDIRKRA